MTPLLQAKNVSLEYWDGDKIIKAVDNINLQLPPTGLFGILGPSGSGKTSLLYLLSGLKEPSKGEILYQGRSLDSDKYIRNLIRRTEMGFVFQSHFLIEYLNVFENIMIGADISYPDSKSVVENLIKELALTELVGRRIDQLSGGQKQKVTIARALANNPKVIFVDEPTSSLDHVTGKKVIKLLERISKNACVIIVTHDETNISNADYIFSIWDGKIHGMGKLKLNQI